MPYLCDAAELLELNLDSLQEVISESEKCKKRRPCFALYDLHGQLSKTEERLFHHVRNLLVQETGDENATDGCCLSEGAQKLRTVREQACRKQCGSGARNTLVDTASHFPTRNERDTLLFRLVVELQHVLRMLTFIEKVTGFHRKQTPVSLGTQKAHFSKALIVDSSGLYPEHFPLFLSLSASTLVFMASRRHTTAIQLPRRIAMIVLVSSVASMTYVTTHWFLRQWANFWLSTTVSKSVSALEEWNTQWLIVSRNNVQAQPQEGSTPSIKRDASPQQTTRTRLMEYASRHSPKVRKFCECFVSYSFSTHNYPFRMSHCGDLMASFAF